MLSLRMDTTEAAPVAAPTALLPTMGDACVSCGAGLQTDQRYCLECGARSGPPRLAFMDGRPRPQAEPPPSAPGPALARGPVAARRPAPGITLIAGVATLLLAMGVGVLIGTAGNRAPAPAASSRVQVVSAPAAAPAAGAATPTAGTTTTSTTPSTSTTPGAAAKSAAKPAASSTSTKKTTLRKPVKVGSKGHGPGYKDGKFTGDFFGP
jgi:hypothetical protein